MAGIHSIRNGGITITVSIRQVFVIAALALLFALAAYSLTQDTQNNPVIPTVRSTHPLNGSIDFNTTDKTIEIYYNGYWYYAGNGTVKP